MDQIINLFKDFQLVDFFDWLIVSILVYLILKLFKETRAWPILGGLVILILPLIIAPVYKLNTLIWILKNLIPVAATSLVVIFQPELRRGLEQIGRGRMLSRNTGSFDNKSRTINEVLKATRTLSSTRIGALIVLSREASLNEVVENGITMNAQVSKEILLNIFTPNTPLHDGAVIIRDDIIRAAACFLPLTDNPDIAPTTGTRHRAGLGITEVSDALAVAVSEETGAISIMINGKMTRNVDPNELAKLLEQFYIHPKERGVHPFNFIKNHQKNEAPK